MKISELKKNKLYDAIHSPIMLYRINLKRRGGTDAEDFVVAQLVGQIFDKACDALESPERLDGKKQ